MWRGVASIEAAEANDSMLFIEGAIIFFYKGIPWVPPSRDLPR